MNNEKETSKRTVQHKQIRVACWHRDDKECGDDILGKHAGKWCVERPITREERREREDTLAPKFLYHFTITTMLVDPRDMTIKTKLTAAVREQHRKHVS